MDESSNFIPKINFYNILDEDIPTTSNEDNLMENKFEKKKRTRTRKKRKHDIFKQDNIRSRLMNHFFNFIISYLNAYLKVHVREKKKKETFKKISYELRNNLNVKKTKFLMNLTIKELCNLDITSKNNQEKQYNKLLLEKYSHYFNQEFLNLTISQFYEDYYLNNKYIFNNLNDENLKFFKHFIEKEKKINFNRNQNPEKYLKKINFTAETLTKTFINKTPKEFQKKNLFNVSVSTYRPPDNFSNFEFDDSLFTKYFFENMNDDIFL